MRKTALLCASVLTAMYGIAQDVPNRLIVNSTAGISTGYVIEDIKDVSFALVEGEVAAEVKIKSVALDQLTLDVKRTPDCASFKLGVFPGTVAANMKTAAAANAMFGRGDYETYYQDFTDATLSGLDLSAGSDYAVVTLAMDKYDTPSNVGVFEFSTPNPDVVGNPDVTVTVTDRTRYSFKATVTPNSDCYTYYCVAGEKGMIEKQYEQMGAMFGFASMNDLIKSWGVEREGETTIEWKDFAPNTDYEIYIAMTDAEGNFAPYKVVETSTLSMGGSGAAYVDIELKDYKLADWEGEMRASQFISYTPNDQASCYRFGVYLEEEFEAGKQEILDYLCSDPEMPTAHWFFYEPMVTDYPIDTNTKFVVIAAAKNADGVWGEINEKHFTTPAAVQGAPAKVTEGKTLRSRDFKRNMERGKVPSMPRPGKLIAK